MLKLIDGPKGTGTKALSDGQTQWTIPNLPILQRMVDCTNALEGVDPGETKTLVGEHRAYKTKAEQAEKQRAEAAQSVNALRSEIGYLREHVNDSVRLAERRYAMIEVMEKSVSALKELVDAKERTIYELRQELHKSRDPTFVSMDRLGAAISELPEQFQRDMWNRVRAYALPAPDYEPGVSMKRLREVLNDYVPSETQELIFDDIEGEYEPERA
jgi:hypothetical protein